VGVEVIRARGVDVEKLIEMLIANAAAEFVLSLKSPIDAEAELQIHLHQTDNRLLFKKKMVPNRILMQRKRIGPGGARHSSFSSLAI
jgi:hypothetical protein